MFPNNYLALPTADVLGPTAGRGLGEISGSSYTPNTTTGDFQRSRGVDEHQNADAVGKSGDPVRWFVALVVLLGVFMYFSERAFAGENKYANLKLSLYNVLTISLAATIGITVFKALFTRFPVPGLSTIFRGV